MFSLNYYDTNTFDENLFSWNFGNLNKMELSCI